MSETKFILLQQSNSKEEIIELNELLNEASVKTKLINSTPPVAVATTPPVLSP